MASLLAAAGAAAADMVAADGAAGVVRPGGGAGVSRTRQPVSVRAGCPGAAGAAAAERMGLLLAEVVRRGLEHMVQIYPQRDAGTWQPPAPSRLGAFRAPADAWRELANEG